MLKNLLKLKWKKKFSGARWKTSRRCKYKTNCKEDTSDKLLTDIKKKIGLESNNTENQKDVVHMNLPKNQILYGPPGTGKTYSVVQKALEIVDPEIHQQLIENNADRKEWMDAYKRYTEEKQIQFCTFHQSYSYEDFVEGLRSDVEETSGQLMVYF